jgi:hypothetical protein
LTENPLTAKYAGVVVDIGHPTIANTKTDAKMKSRKLRQVASATLPTLLF